ncbi:MAG: carbohydrate binding family 9 domain-containing protein [Candidatus Aminicenantes bacterium]|nr:MAG: carbohydrate binding family 9 domain-containing protein [Candidatus Aminicenantes bacterium]
MKKHPHTAKPLYASLILFLLLPSFTFSQFPRKSSLARRVSYSPRIDGKIDEDCWKELPLFENFIQWGPYNGNPPSQKTVARVGYNNEAIYIGCICFDDSPEDMKSEVCPRDSFSFNSEVLAVHISPFNDGINSVFLYVSLAGVQRDIKLYGDKSEVTWDAVWESAVGRTDSGWTVEIKIPFSALRFSNKSVQDWGFNIWRWFARNMEWSCWSYVSNEIDCWWKEMGLLQGIKDLSPPVRLSFMPYLSGYAERGLSRGWRNFFNGGLDLKYGLTDSFTLDMSLIPDFGQVESDELELNLTPYEIKYIEKRQLFTEGMELFQKGDIFYSRRIGARPVGHDRIYSQISDSEQVLNNPDEAPLLNTTKISGRTNGGLGIGFLNAMTAPTYADVQDMQTGKKREILTQPFTNLNIFVLDQSLFENSYISFINSNVLRKGYIANVTATEFKLADRNNIYKLRGIGGLSSIAEDDSATIGYKLGLEAGKTGGSFQYLYALSVINDTYNQNDLGYLRRNNEIINQFSLSYNILKPFGIFLSIRNKLDILYSRVYKPGDFSEFTVQYAFSAGFKNRYSFGAQLILAPFEGHDYYETRTPNRYVVRNKYFYGQVTLSTDPRQSLAAEMKGSYRGSYAYYFDVRSWFLEIIPTLRFNDRLKMNLNLSFGKDLNEPGFVERHTETDLILFGKRDRQTLVNMLTLSYIFNNKASLNFRLRHYWSKANYDSFYELNENGRLSPLDYMADNDINYNAFNIDMIFRWNFAPGSEMLLNWKNSINTSDDRLDVPYCENLKNTLDAPQVNSLSIKILYYFDYLDLKKLFGKK